MGSDRNDSLDGSEASEVIDGGPGNDVIRGNEGDDTITGGPGADIFVENIFSGPADGNDVILDFELGVDTWQQGTFSPFDIISSESEARAYASAGEIQGNDLFFQLEGNPGEESIRFKDLVDPDVGDEAEDYWQIFF